MSRINSLYGSQTTPVVLCKQNSMINTRNTSLYVSQPSSAVFASKTTTLGTELQVSMGPRPHLCFLHSKQRLQHQNCKSLWVPALICCFFCIHNGVIMTRINILYGSQTSPVVVCMQNNEINFRITSLYGSQPSSAVFACKTATL